MSDWQTQPTVLSKRTTAKDRRSAQAVNQASRSGNVDVDKKCECRMLSIGLVLYVDCFFRLRIFGTKHLYNECYLSLFLCIRTLSEVFEAIKFFRRCRRESAEDWPKEHCKLGPWNWRAKTWVCENKIFCLIMILAFLYFTV